MTFKFPTFGTPKLSGYLNVGELLKVFVGAHAVAVLVALAVAILSAVAANASTIFPNGVIAFIAVQVIALVVGALKKLPTGSANS